MKLSYFLSLAIMLIIFVSVSGCIAEYATKASNLKSGTEGKTAGQEGTNETGTGTEGVDVIPYNENESPGANEVMDTEPITEFIVPEEIDYAVINEPYTYSFCRLYSSDLPEETTGPTSTELCKRGSGKWPTNITGGNPPYHFQLESGSGFPPMGLILNTNGNLTGTPTALGKSNFSVCVVDESGTQKCSNTSLEVKDVYATFDSLTCEKIHDYEDIDIFSLIAKGTAKGEADNELVYSDELWENSNDLSKSIGYSDIVNEESSCGSWSLPYTTVCENTTGAESTISWTLVYRAVLHPGPRIVKASVRMATNSMTKNLTTPILKEVTCPQ